MNRRFYVADCPPDRCVADWLDDQTGFRAKGDRIPTRQEYPPLFRVVGLPIDVAGLERAIRAVFQRHGWHGWRHASGESEAYGGFSLVKNPNHPETADPHASVLGTSDLDLGRFYGSALPLGRDSYQDTYGFCVRTEGSREGAMGRLVDGFSRTMVRSSVRELHARFYEPVMAQIGPTHPFASAAGWHCDERVCENLRINVPVTGAPIFTMEIATPEPECRVVYDAPLELGHAYAWNTYWPHRPMAKEKADLSRINIVLGFAPWFDYDAVERCWVANPFFGELHPFDMLADGHVHPDATLAEAEPV